MGDTKWDGQISGLRHRGGLLRARIFRAREEKPVVLQSAEQMELDLLLEELAEFIESEDGILIP